MPELAHEVAGQAERLVVGVEERSDDRQQKNVESPQHVQGQQAFLVVAHVVFLSFLPPAEGRPMSPPRHSWNSRTPGWPAGKMECFARMDRNHAERRKTLQELSIFSRNLLDNQPHKR